MGENLVEYVDINNCQRSKNGTKKYIIKIDNKEIAECYDYTTMEAIIAGLFDKYYLESPLEITIERVKYIAACNE